MAITSEQLKYNMRLFVFYTMQTLYSLPPFQRIVLAFCILALLPGYWAVRVASKTYFTVTYKTHEVSAHPSFTDPKDVVVDEPRVLPFGSGTSFVAYVYVKNENISLAANTLTYKFRFLNSAGEQVYSSTGRTYLLPSERKMIVVPRFTTTEKVTKAEVEVDQVHWQNRLSIPRVQLSTSEPNFYNQNDPQAFVVEGTISNDTPYAIKVARLTYTVYNAAGDIISVSQRDEKTLRPGERRAYKQLWPGFQGSSVQRVEVKADTDPLDATNIQVDKTGKTAPSLQREKEEEVEE